MTSDQIMLFGLVLLTFVFLMWGRFRYDLVVFAALLIAFAASVISKDEVFSEFGHPAVVILALVLIASRGLSRSGAIEMIAQKVIKGSRGQQAHIGIMKSISAGLFSILNNVADALIAAPIGVGIAQGLNANPDSFLMAVAVAALLHIP